VVDDPGRGVVDQREERRQQRRVGARLVGCRDGGRDDLGIVDEPPGLRRELREVSRFGVERVVERSGDGVRLRRPRCDQGHLTSLSG